MVFNTFTLFSRKNLYENLDDGYRDKEEWRGEQQERFEDTLQYAKEHTAFWDAFLQQHGIDTDTDLYDDELPVIDSDIVRQNQPPAADDFLLKSAIDEQHSIYQSSGTTGTRKSYFYSQSDWERDTLRNGIRTLRLAGIDENDMFANYFPKTGTNISGPANDDAIRANGSGLISFPDDYTPHDQYEAMKQFGVTSLGGLTSHMEALGLFFEQEGIDPSILDLNAVLLAGEFSTPERRDWIQERLDADNVVDFYGSTEFAFSGIESADRNLDIFEDQLFVAAYDEDGNRLEDGEEGLLIFTYLKEPGQTPGMPLLGLEIGDYGKVIDRNKDVGGYPMTEIDVYGKAKDEFSVGSVDLRPSFFEAAIRSFGDTGELTGEYQIQIDDELGSRTEMQLLVEADQIDETSEVYREQLRNHILDEHNYLEDTVSRGAVDFDVVLEENIEFDPGKPSRVIDRRDHG